MKKLPWRWQQISSRKPIFYNNVDKPPLVLHISTANLRGFARFLTPSLLEGNHLLMPALCQPKPETFRKYYYALLHSCSHCDLDHFCWIPHKFADTVTWFSFIIGVEEDIDTKVYRGTLPDWTAITTLNGNIKFSRKLPLLIMWTKPSRVLYCSHYDLDQSWSVIH